MMRALVAVLLATAALAGCTETPAAGDGVDPASDPTAGGAPASGGGGDSPSSPTPDEDPAPPEGNQTQSPEGASNASAGATPPAGAPTRQWPSLESAKIRPGVQTFAGNSQCTSNFVFTSPDQQTLYVGVAAHCFRGASLGAPVEFGEGGTGTLAYSSWITMGSDGGDPDTGADPACSAEESQAICDANDFALVRVDEASEALVHPAMLHFGGPTALAPSAEASVGDKVLTYGHSGLRMGVDPTNWHEGYVLSQNGWTTTTYTATPGVPGDSGSGVLLGDGRALGVLVTVTIAPLTGSNGVTSLDLALAYAKEKAGIDARLATWELLNPGALPA